MCCFSQPVESVSTTRIFARPTARGTQFLVYQMNYKSAVENAMILPLPVRQPAREESLRFIDFERYPNFFDDLKNGFPFPNSGIACGGPHDPTAGETLEVFDVGNYIASFVPVISDFSRLDPRFTLPDATWDKLPEYADYGFAVFQLKSGALQPHPMAFEFKTALDSIYFPTVHIHDGEVHEQEEFDHILYLQHAGYDSLCYGYINGAAIDEATGLIRSKVPAKQCCDVASTAGVVAADLLLHRMILQGQLVNRDIIVPATGDPQTPTVNLRRIFSAPLFWLGAWFTAIAAVIWLFARRDKIMRMRGAAQSGAPVTDPDHSTVD